MKQGWLITHSSSILSALKLIGLFFRIQKISSTYLCSLSVDKGRIGVISLEMPRLEGFKKNARRIAGTSIEFDRRLVLIK